MQSRERLPKHLDIGYRIMLTRQRGFTLVEMMVSLVVGLVVAGMALSLYSAILRANATAMQLSMLNQSLQAVLDLVSRDVQRAGYMANAAQNLARDANGNPINAGGNVTTLNREAMFSLYTLNASGAMTTTLKDLQRLHVSAPLYDCILLRYDANGDGALAGTSPPEIMGYRYDASTKAVEFETWDSAASQSCGSTNWENLTAEKDLEITAFTFSISPSGGASTEYGQRTITINIAGRSKQRTDLSLNLEREVRMRNDQF